MPAKNNNLVRITGILILAVGMLSCSNKLVTSETSLPMPGKKIVFNSVFTCSPEKLTNSSAGKWYSGNGKANTIIGKFLINFDFFTASPQASFREQDLYNFFSPSLPGDMHPVTGPVYAVITLDGKNSLWIEYPGLNYKNGLNLFGVEGQVTGGTGIFTNATGTINSKIVTDRTNDMAATSHAGVVYLQ